MKEDILEYLLADPTFTLEEIVDIIDFHMKKSSDHKTYVKKQEIYRLLEPREEDRNK